MSISTPKMPPLQQQQQQQHPHPSLEDPQQKQPVSALSPEITLDSVLQNNQVDSTIEDIQNMQSQITQIKLTLSQFINKMASLDDSNSPQSTFHDIQSLVLDLKINVDDYNAQKQKLETLLNQLKKK